MIQNRKKFPYLVPVLVTYSSTVQILALKARNHIWSNFSNAPTEVFQSHEEQAHIPSLQAELSSGRVTFFVGAGVSSSSALPTWAQLIERLAEESQANIQVADTPESLLKAAESAKQFLGDRFPEAFRKALGYGKDQISPHPSFTHYLIAGLPLRDVVTTNYDTLLEQAFKAIKLTAFTLNEPKDVANAPVGSFHTNILKIHGDISHPDNTVFSESDYQNYFTNKPAVSTLLRGLLLSRTFVFIGYSLRDPNLNVIIDEVGTILKDARRPCYAVVFEASDAEVVAWKLRGVNLLRVKGDTIQAKTYSLWSFLDLLQEKYYTPNHAWLAPDSKDFVTNSTTAAMQTQITQLTSTLKSLAEIVRDRSGPLDESTIDFIMPFLLVGAQHGLAVHSDIWEKIADHYKARQPPIESNVIASITATIQALAQSTGRQEQTYQQQLLDTEKFFRK